VRAIVGLNERRRTRRRLLDFGRLDRDDVDVRCRPGRTGVFDSNHDDCDDDQRRVNDRRQRARAACRSATRR
jgi:hypothetical protein